MNKSWFRYCIQNWKRIVFKYSFSAYSQAGKTWSLVQYCKPHLDGMKLYMPNNQFIDAGYINLKTHEIVEFGGITEIGRSRLNQMYNELKQKCDE